MYPSPTPDLYTPRAAPEPPSYRDAMYVPSRDLVGPGVLDTKRYRPLTLRNWVVAVVVITLLALAVAIEVSLKISNQNGGFATPSRNVFTGVSPRFLTAFFPTLLVAGLLVIWQASDRSYRELQPYIVLARGNVTAAEGLLANYSGLSMWSTITNSLKFRHYLILLSTITTLLGSLLQPLAGSIIQFEQLPRTTDGIFIQSKKTLGLSPDVLDLNAFLAAAGFADAAVFHGLPDPPFIHGGWSIAEFQLPAAQVLNGTLSVNTTAIQTTTNCEVPQTFSLSTTGTSNFTIQATNAAGCTGNTTFDSESTTSHTQYGVVPVANCGSADVQFMPIMFWFFHRKPDDIQTPQGASVFCQPTIKALNVVAKTDLNNDSIIDVTSLDNVTTSNNVTGGQLNGQAFNSVQFPPSNDTFVHARSVSIGAGVSGSIFRFASQSPGGVQSIFDDPNGFLTITQKIYTQHLSISAKSNYFLDAPSNVPASMTVLAPRLVIDELPAHALTVVLALIGLSALFIHILHSRQRKRFFLAASPGSIAHIISMTAHARFGEKLYPYDDDDTLALKLTGLTFSLDPRTGAVVADRDLGPVTARVGLVTPYTVPDMRPRSSTGGLTENTFGGAYYADDAKTRTSRSPSLMVDDERPARWRRDTLGEGSSTRSSQLELHEVGQHLPSYADDLESQNGRGLAVPPVVVEKRGRSSATTLSSGRTSQMGESSPLLADQR
ncbi:hypothetical protein DFH06DRAFT_40452 [Mycena polygramma]|nr:hypothetical protein DFH06DRAFT_40452 [Mycena polygramma]